MVKSEWVEWGGGDYPVDKNVEVDIMLRGGVAKYAKALLFNWEHRGAADDIMKYRIKQQDGSTEHGKRCCFMPLRRMYLKNGEGFGLYKQEDDDWLFVDNQTLRLVWRKIMMECEACGKEFTVTCGVKFCSECLPVDQKALTSHDMYLEARKYQIIADTCKEEAGRKHSKENGVNNQVGEKHHNKREAPENTDEARITGKGKEFKMNVNDMEVGTKYVNEYNQVFELTSYSVRPTATFVNVETGESIDGVVECHLFESFTKLDDCGCDKKEKIVKRLIGVVKMLSNRNRLVDTNKNSNKFHDCLSRHVDV